MPIEITMPALSPTMTEGNLAKWNKKEGDKIKAGDVIAEIETDKATMEVEAPIDGVLRSIVVPAGTTDVLVNRLIGDKQPGAQKLTWTAMPTYRADAPLKPSGLVGPVSHSTHAQGVVNLWRQRGG